MIEKKEYERRPNTVCKLCKTACYKRPSQITKSKCGELYCSQKCYHEDNPPRVKICPVCGKLFRGHSQINCSRTCANVSRVGIKYNQGQPNNKAKKGKDIRSKLIDLRGPKCEQCICDNINILQVHHIVEKSNGGTDEESNLLLICPNCHYTIHYGDSRC